MSIRSRILWAAEFIIIFSAFFAVQIPIRTRRLPVLKAVVFVVRLFLILLMPILFIHVDNWFTYRCADLIAAVDIVLLSDAAAEIVESAVRRVRQFISKGSGKQPCQLRLIAALGAAFCILITLYGSINTGNVIRNDHTWKAKGLRQPHTFAYASDIHAENDHVIRNLARFCDQVNEAKPEFVILGGDVTDEKTSYEVMVRTWQIISEIDVPVYFVYGNHDRQPDSEIFGGRTYSNEQLEENIRAAGVTILQDEYVKAADDLILLGREDMSLKDERAQWSELIDPYEGEGALIVADHQPLDDDQLDNISGALQLSGHLHAGQLWPLKTICRVLGMPVLGEYHKPDIMLYVTSGTGGWAIPFRTESRSAWELITLTP